jgi:hypothetical protein
VSRTARLLAGDGNAQGYGLAVAVLRPAELKLAWAAAGIDQPLLVRRLGDAVPLPFVVEPPLRGDPDRVVAEHALSLPSRATLVIASPAIATPMPAGEGAEGGAPSGLGRERLLAALREAEDPAVAGVLDAARKGLLAHTGGQRATRDRLCVAARLLV